MKSESFFLSIVTFFLGLAGIVLFAGCEAEAYIPAAPQYYAEADDPAPVPSGTATICGQVADFDTTTLLAIRPHEYEEEGEEVVEEVKPDVFVHLEGPVSVTVETDEDGVFVFGEVLAGTYEISFECEGVEVRYRGRSGQAAKLKVEADEILEMTGVKICGGEVNVGNIKIRKAKDVEEEDPVVEEPEPEPEPEPEEPQLPPDLTGEWKLYTVEGETVVLHEYVTLQQVGETQLTGQSMESGAVFDGEVYGETVWLMKTDFGATMEPVMTQYNGVLGSQNGMSGTWYSTDGREGGWEADRVSY